MTTKIAVWGTKGKIYADRQEVQVYLRSHVEPLEGYGAGWNVRCTTELTKQVWYYLRGEEYSEQIDHFIQTAKAGRLETRSTFRTAVDADLVAAGIVRMHRVRYDSARPCGRI